MDSNFGSSTSESYSDFMNDLKIVDIKSDITQITSHFDAIIAVDGLPSFTRLLKQFGSNLEKSTYQKVLRNRQSKNETFVWVPREECGFLAVHFFLIVINQPFDPCVDDLLLVKLKRALSECLLRIIKNRCQNVAVTNIAGADSCSFLAETIKSWANGNDPERILKNVTIVSEEISTEDLFRCPRFIGKIVYLTFIEGFFSLLFSLYRRHKKSRPKNC